MAKPIKKIKKVKYKIKNLKIHSDERGWLVEMLKGNKTKDDIKQIYIAIIKPGKTRGNHYHLKRKEWFFIAKGQANIYLEDIKTKKRICLKVFSEKPRVITIFPKISHAVKNVGKETVYLISAQSDLYNRERPDSIPYIICK